MKCNHEEKFFCKECYDYLCDNCKLKHPHKKNNLLLISTLQISLKKEIEIIKEEIKPYYFKYEKLDNLDKKIGLINLANIFKDIYGKLEEFFLKEDLQSINNKLSLIKTYSKKIKDINLNLTMKNTETINLMKSLKEYKSNMSEISSFSDNLLHIFEDKEMFLFELYNILFLNNNTDKLSDTTLNLSSFNIEPIEEEEKPIFSVNTSKINNLIKLNEFEEKIKLLENENAKLIEINQKYHNEIKRIELLQNQLIETNDNLNLQMKNKENYHYEPFNFIEESTLKSSEVKDIVYEKKDKIISEAINHIIENKFSQKYYDELDQFSISSILKSNTKLLLEKLKLTEIIFEDYNDLDVIKKYFLPNYQKFTISNINKEINDTIIEKISIYYFNLIYENRCVITNILFDNFLQNYTINSKKYKNIKNIDLKSCQINDIDIGKLVTILQISTKLTDIFLQNNEITDNGFSTLLPIIFNNKSVKNVYIDNNKLSENSLKSLYSYVKTINTKQVTLKVLSLQNNNFSEKGKELLKPIKLILKVLIYI